MVTASGLPATPATKSIASTMAARMIVVPRLGCSMSSAANTANTVITGRRVTRQSCTLSARRASRSAAKRISASFASSDGWMRSWP